MDEYDSSALTLNLHFTPAQFFDIHPHFQRVHSTVAGPLPTALYTTEWEGERETTSIVYNLRSSGWVDCEGKNRQLWDVTIFLKSLINVHARVQDIGGYPPV